MSRHADTPFSAERSRGQHAQDRLEAAPASHRDQERARDCSAAGAGTQAEDGRPQGIGVQAQPEEERACQRKRSHSGPQWLDQSRPDQAEPRRIVGRSASRRLDERLIGKGRSGHGWAQNRLGI